jgi:hypothetical protein
MMVLLVTSKVMMLMTKQFDQAAKQGVWKIYVEKQPAKSPGTNVLDLSFSELGRQNSEVWDLRQQLMV